MNVESALKLLPITKKSSNDPSFKDKDGDDGDFSLHTVVIEVATNGYLVTFSYDDGTEDKFIEEDFDEVLKLIRSRH